MSVRMLVHSLLPVSNSEHILACTVAPASIIIPSCFLQHHLPFLFFEIYMQVVRSRLQEQGHHSEKRYSGVVDCIKKVFQQEGITGFYRGCATNLIRTTPAAVITFTSFEMIHRFLVTTFPPESHRQTFWNW